MSGSAKRFAFLICSERSGSNLVTRMIGAHPQVCAPPPTHMFRIVAQNLTRYGDLRGDISWRALVEDVKALFDSMFGDWRAAPEWQNYAGWPASQRSAQRLLTAIYEAEVEAAGVEMAMVKENHTYSFLPFIIRHLPDARWVYVVRDPRDMALSWRKAGALRGGVLRAASIWRSDQEGLIQARAWLGAASGPLIRYEDLLADPERILSEAFVALGLPPAPDAHRTFHEQTDVRRDAQAVYDWRNLSQPLMRDNAGRSIQELSSDELRYVEAVCGPLMRVFGYEPITDASSDDVETLRERLEPLEPIEKKSYEETSEREKERRKARSAALDRIAGRAISPPFPS